jgi:DNA-directed RNA polymerase subunit RPC12/RpoP
MTRRKYICSECGNIFNEELSELIENNVQVFCEKCGAPFTLEKTKFTEKEFKPIKEVSERKRGKRLF